MKQKYKYQRFQADATRSVTDIFRGQPYREGAKTDRVKDGSLFGEGIGNYPLMLETSELTENVQQIQQRWSLEPVDRLQGPVDAPMGHYNPDWAVCFCEGTVKHIYFIAETKGNEWQRSQLRGVEDAKIECAARHFKAISKSGNVVFGVVKDYKTLYDKVMK